MNRLTSIISLTKTNKNNKAYDVGKSAAGFHIITIGFFLQEVDFWNG